MAIKLKYAATAMAMALAASAAQASLISFNVDTTADYEDGVSGPSVFARGNGFLAPGATARLILDGPIDPDAVVDGPLTLSLGYREAHNHTGDVHIGHFDLVHGDTSVRLSTFDAANGFSTEAFNGAALSGDWFLRFVSGTGPDPWVSFGGGGQIDYSIPADPGPGEGSSSGGSSSGGSSSSGGGSSSGGSSSSGGGSSSGGASSSGGGAVSAPGPLGLIAAMGMLAFWRRGRRQGSAA